MTADAIIHQLIPSIRVGDYRAFYIEREHGGQIEMSIKLNSFPKVAREVEDIHRNREEHQDKLKEFGGSAASLAAYYGAITTSTIKKNKVSLELTLPQVKGQLIIQLYIRFIQQLAENAIRFIQLQPSESGPTTERLCNDNSQEGLRENYNNIVRQKQDSPLYGYQDQKGRGIHNED